MIKIRTSSDSKKPKDLNNNDYYGRAEHSKYGMLFMPLLRRRLKSTQMKYFILWFLSIFLVIWLMNSHTNNCDENSQRVKYQRLNEDIDDQSLLGVDALIDRSEVHPYSLNTPLIFVGGVPR